MRYLLIGNALDANVTSAVANSDVIVQINSCYHHAMIPPGRTNYIFLTNSGEVLPSLIKQLLSSYDNKQFEGARIVLARNPIFYTLKNLWLKVNRQPGSREFKISPEWRSLKNLWPVEFVSYPLTFRLNRRLRSMGMPKTFMPSTGMIAYEWVRARLHPDDSLAIAGFTFEGWERHPWSIEKTLIRPISPKDN